MTTKKGKERITEYFGSSNFVIFIGTFCGAYFFIHFLPDNDFIAKILPPMPLPYFYGLAAAVLAYQLLTWKLFKLFQGDWYKSLFCWLLFICEWATMMFGASLISWPVYFIYGFFSSTF